MREDDEPRTLLGRLAREVGTPAGPEQSTRARGDDQVVDGPEDVTKARGDDFTIYDAITAARSDE